MVNELQTIDPRVVKAKRADEDTPRVTSKGGLVLAQSLARHWRLWSDARRLLPARKDLTQGFQTPAVVASVVHGLLAGGRGFSATEPMRGDKPLLKMLGLKRAPSAETVEEVVKYVALEQNGTEGTNSLLERQAGREIDATSRHELASCHGFVPFWADGSLLEVTGKRFDSIKTIKGRRGQLCVAAFCCDYLTGVDFANQGQGESTVACGLIDRSIRHVLRPRRLMAHLLILLDSHYGYEPTLSQLESYRQKPAYIVGVMGLNAAMAVMNDLPEVSWRDTGANSKRGWDASGLAEAWVQCEEWDKKRPIVCRRWRNMGEMIWNYAAVTTNLTPQDNRIRELMEATERSFAEVIWDLYSHKQAMENQWKDLLCDLGLHHPPCAKARVNAVFYGVAGLAYNLAVGIRRLTLKGRSRRMRLWRLRREVFDLAGYAVNHGRAVILHFVDARDHLIERLLDAMGCVARC
jgi:hypothetical protein